MYAPPPFREEDLPRLHATMVQVRLANLVTATAQGLVATPLPLLLVADEGPLGTLYGHLARPNPQWRLPPQGEAMALFSGPDAYVSPSFYPSKQADPRVVPTWNYVAVHAYGTPEFFDEKDRLLDLLGALTDTHEAGRAERWAVADAPRDYVEGMLRGIVGLRLPITRIEGKRKLSQNRSEADRAGVAAALAASEVPGDQALAREMAQD
ncbi:MAG TPA: FMN-binding negative transcriptional regulator [Novosphingobium sp.]|nr:FMN-binding negative transcriptional regulator [Novosphingobium sp.]